MAEKSSRGVLYIHWGETDQILQRSIQSLKAIHPELPHHVVELPKDSNLLSKARMAEYSPFDETLYLDADTVVLGNLDFGFQKAAEFGLACSICENPWARRFAALRGETVEYNTGVLFFTKKVRPVFDLWAGMVGKIDSSMRFYRGKEIRTMPVNDQAGFALAVEKNHISPFVLPMNWNFRPVTQHGFFGPIKIWHDYTNVPDVLRTWNEEQTRPDAVIRFGTCELF